MDVLNVPMNRKENDAKATSIKDYLIHLLETVWCEEESFSGKRPFGNSGWKYELAQPLVKAGLLKGDLDQDGYADNYSEKKLDQLIRNAINQLGA